MPALPDPRGDPTQRQVGRIQAQEDNFDPITGRFQPFEPRQMRLPAERGLESEADTRRGEPVQLSNEETTGGERGVFRLQR